jgi:Fe-S-cluster containining protein
MWITDITVIKEMARLKKAENERWAKEVRKKYPTKSLDTHIHHLAKEVSLQIDCLACGNCCKELMPSVSLEEAQVLANLKEETLEDFAEKFLQWDAEHLIYFTRHSPCSFLENNACTVYADRPQSCHDFPNLSKSNMKYRLKSVLKNYGVCPIVYNVVEEMKERLV